jgi:hypothetical protein
LFDKAAKFAAIGFSWRFDALAINVELPSMEGAAQAVSFVTSKGKICATVGAVSVE